ncbi:MAG TPA: hypothetical protein VF230_06455 [Acidimicrobiales bacterium]
MAVALVALVVAGLAVGPLSTLVEGPSFVARITFVNPSEYDLSVDATDGTRDGWVSVGTARKESTTSHEAIIDQGEVWIFRFTGQGRDAGELRMTRRDLERATWTVQIPDSIAAELRAEGAPPTP